MRLACIKTVMVVLVLASVIGGCNNDEVGITKAVEVESFNYTGCKEFDIKSAFTEQLIFTTTSDNYLHVKHVDAMFNCCPVELISNVRLDNDTITLTEDEKEGLCDCICPYDLESEIGPLEYGEYLFVLEIGENNKYAEFTILFTADTDTSFFLNK